MGKSRPDTPFAKVAKQLSKKSTTTIQQSALCVRDPAVNNQRCTYQRSHSGLKGL